MSDKPSIVRAVLSLLVGCALVFYSWRKRRRQFGTPMDHVRVIVNERPMLCHVCGGDGFEKREGLINTTFVTFFQFNFLNESAACMTCKTCGYVHWFAHRRGYYPESYIRYQSDAARSPSDPP